MKEKNIIYIYVNNNNNKIQGTWHTWAMSYFGLFILHSLYKSQSKYWPMMWAVLLLLISGPVISYTAWCSPYLICYGVHSKLIQSVGCYACFTFYVFCSPILWVWEIIDILFSKTFSSKRVKQKHKHACYKWTQNKMFQLMAHYCKLSKSHGTFLFGCDSKCKIRPHVIKLL